MESLLDAFTCVVENKKAYHQRTCKEVDSIFHATKFKNPKQFFKSKLSAYDATHNTNFLLVNPDIDDEEFRMKSDKRSIIYFNSLFSSCVTPQKFEFDFGKFAKI
ncbi:hypothetical protein ACTFIY_004733 [Dictyostelium cf. discoideum]